MVQTLFVVAGHVSAALPSSFHSLLLGYGGRKKKTYKKPMANRAKRRHFWPMRTLSFHTTGMGRKKVRKSVAMRRYWFERK